VKKNIYQLRVWLKIFSRLPFTADRRHASVPGGTEACWHAGTRLRPARVPRLGPRIFPRPAANDEKIFRERAAATLPLPPGDRGRAGATASVPRGVIWTVGVFKIDPHGRYRRAARAIASWQIVSRWGGNGRRESVACTCRLSLWHIHYKCDPDRPAHHDRFAANVLVTTLTPFPPAFVSKFSSVCTTVKSYPSHSAGYLDKSYLGLVKIVHSLATLDAFLAKWIGLTS